MVFRRFFDAGLAHASFLVGCPGTGEAIIVDPNRDFDVYFAAAAEEGLRIAFVTETHIHADFLSGARELAKRAGALLFVSDEGDADWKYAFAAEDNVRLLKDGSRIEFGAVRLQAMHTPGHTPEHLAFVLTDTAASEAPCAVLTGDFIFVGDVGRPDLLENAAGQKGTAEPGARRLYQSLQRFRSLPDHVLLWPSHGAGSACGKALGGAPATTLGYEIQTNWAFRAGSEDAFVAEVLAGQPDAPPYFGRMKVQNKMGPAMLAARSEFSRTAAPPPGTFILDTRPSQAFQERHLAGSLSVGMCRSFTSYAGWLVPADQPIALIAQSESQALAARRALSLIGIDDVASWSGPEAIAAAPTSRLQSTPWTTGASADPRGFMLDVRSSAEYREGHFEGAHQIHYGRLAERSSEIPRDRKVQVYCLSGERSAIAASLLQKLGFEDVVDVRDGYAGLSANAEAPVGSR